MEDDESLVQKIRSYIEGRAVDKMEVFEKQAERLKREAPPEQFVELEQKLDGEREQLREKYQLQNWLTDAANRAKQISLVTHAPKFTHSDTRSIGFLCRDNVDDVSILSGNYLCSASLTHLQVDVVGNAAALDVAGLLQLKADGVSLLDEIVAGSSSSLKDLADSDDHYHDWLTGFQDALKSNSCNSGQLSKQLYYPVKDNYHLLSPLYATSLSQVVYERLTEAAYSERSKKARKARKDETFFERPVISFPKVAQQNFGGTKPQNISKLNTTRYGRGFLLSSQPPAWQQQVKPPISGQQAFWQGYDRRAYKTANFLKKYLEKIFEQSSAKEQRDFRGELVDELVDTLLIYAAEIQSMKQYAGWSLDCDLSHAEQLWLDIYRCATDDDFRLEREQSDWQETIAHQFASWLNHKIGYKSKTLHPDDHTHQEWSRLLKRKLALLQEDLEVAV